MPMVTSSKMYFVNGNRIRPGTPFQHKGELRPDMTLAADQAPTPVKAKRAKPDSTKEPETFGDLAKQDAAALTPKGAEPGSDTPGTDLV